MEFSLTSFLIGVAILAVGGAIVALHQKIADMVLGGASSYDRVKLVGLITMVGGFVVAINLHVVVLGWLVDIIFHRGSE